MRSVILRSPAKLNLFLKVINRRADGYHNLETLFERIDLCDEIRFTPNRKGDIRIFCSHPQVPKGPKNLVYRVAKLLKDEYEVPNGVDIHILKRIPVAAGLAGGSSNAATALWGLNRIWKLSLLKEQLLSIGSRIGSDVPFFLHNCSWALGTGRGDKIQPLEIPSKLWHLLIVPRIKMYSREVFARLNLELTNKNADVNILIPSLLNNIKEAGKLLHNDLESSILTICPGLVKVKERLEAFRLTGVSFSGSGPAVFGITRSKQEADYLKDILGKRYSQVFAVRTL
jgi:4-diphosphocytidyl-2-C-methyl-D-erythritol kinase